MKTLLVGIIGSMFILSSGISSAASTTKSSSSYKRGSVNTNSSASGNKWDIQSTTTNSWRKTNYRKGTSRYKDSQAWGNSKTGNYNRDKQSGSFKGTDYTTDAGTSTKKTLNKGSNYKRANSMSSSAASGKYKYKRKTR